MKFNHVIFSMLCLLFSVSMSAQEPTRPAPPAGPTTTIEFAESEFNFGKIAQGEKVLHVYSFTNTGTKPFVISSARGSCGCTVPEWPKAPIAPGETGEIFVQFDTKNKMGHQTKQVTITGNTDPPQTILYIKGQIVEELAGSGTPAPVIEFKAADVGKETADFSAYPNPTSTSLNLNLKDFAGKAVSIEIFNSLGQQVEARKVTPAKGELLQFDVSGYEAGIHTVAVSVGGSQRISKRFLVVK